MFCIQGSWHGELAPVSSIAIVHKHKGFSRWACRSKKKLKINVLIVRRESNVSFSNNRLTNISSLTNTCAAGLMLCMSSDDKLSHIYSPCGAQADSSLPSEQGEEGVFIVMSSYQFCRLDICFRLPKKTKQKNNPEVIYSIYSWHI